MSDAILFRSLWLAAATFVTGAIVLLPTKALIAWAIVLILVVMP
ncbi:hypothetical protein [Bradyrhizobium brasilense]|nr:hypothetical protein [Bradyrhizobium brasilense]